MVKVSLAPGMFTYPEDPDSWSESLTPLEGVWHVESGDELRLSTKSAVGSHSIENYVSTTGRARTWFTLNTGKEFDGTKTSAEFHLKLALQDGSWEVVGDYSDGYIILYDIAGKKAQLRVKWGPVDNNFYDWSFPLGPGQGWSESEGFDWTAIKTIEVWVSSGKISTVGSVWIDQPYFSYYELVRPTLVIDSVPQGKHFTLDHVEGYTPSQPYGLDPDVDYSVYIDPVDFDHWEDGSTANPRTIRLVEGEEKTITAYYTTAPPPPPPGKGTLYCHAKADSEDVSASVEVVGVGTYTTPFSLDLDPGTYTLNASYMGQEASQTVTVEEGKIKEVTFYFTAPTVPWIPLAIALGLTVGTVIVLSQIE